MRKTGMRLLAVLLAVVMVLPSVLIPGMAAEATGFTDVPEGSWYEDAVNYVSEKGYMAGVGDNKFAPNDEVTRAMFVTILARITMAETDGTVSAFTDVPANKWYTGAVSWAAENGIVNGVGDGMFAPGKSITRQDLCTILYRFVNAMDYELTVGEEKTFTDSASVSSYAAEAVRYASSVGLIAGYDDGTFRPKATATRAQMAVIIMRLARLLDGQIVKPEPMPAQSFNGAAGDDMTVSVNAPKGALPEGTGMALEPVTDEASLEILAAKAQSRVFAAADISFIKDGEEIEPNAAVEVQISLDNLQNIENPTVVHINKSGNVEYVSSEMVSTTRGGSKALRFMAKDFSVYAVIGDGQTGDNARLTVEFYDSDREGAEPAKSYVVTKYDIVELEDHSKTIESTVPDPALSQSQGTMTFCGWTTNRAYTSSDLLNTDGTYKDCSLDAIRQQIITLLESGTVKEGDTYPVYAMYFNNFTVTYLNETGSTIVRTESIYTKQSSIDDYEVYAAYSAEDSDAAFRGWTVVGDPAQTVIQNYEEIEVSEDVSLKAYVRKGKWITFFEKTNDDPQYKGATYTPPKFIVDGALKKADEPADPVLNGYIFEGWFEKGTNIEFTFSDRTIGRSYDLEAHWTRKTQANYTVLFWKQNLAGTGYDFDKSQVVKNAAVDGSTSVTKLGSGNNTYVTVDGVETKYEGFRVKTGTIESATVKPDDSTVINVYFDRNQYTFTFQDTDGTYTRVRASNVSTSDASNGDYYVTFTINNTTKYWQVYQKTSSYTYATVPADDFASINGSSYTDYSSTPFVAVQNGSYYPVYWYGSSYGWVILVSSSIYYLGDAQVYYSSNPTYYQEANYITVKTVQKPYGADIVDIWNFTGSNGKTYPQTDPVSSWKPTNSTTYTARITKIPKMPAEDITYRHMTTSNTKRRFVYYVEALPESENKVTISGKEYVVYDDFENDFNIVFYNDDFWELNGFIRDRITDSTGKSITIAEDGTPWTSSSSGTTTVSGQFASGAAENTLYFLYDRESYSILYQDGIYYSHSKDNSTGGNQILGRDKVTYRTYINEEDNILYEDDITSYEVGGANYYIPTLTGFDFQGWYLDSACQTAATATSLSKMPMDGVVLYAKWQQRAIRVALYANDGTLPENQDWEFKIAEYEQISSGQEIKPTRTGYEFVGWYEDENFTKPYNFATALFYKENDSTSTADTYSAADRQTFGDSERPFVVGIRKLYAKWRKDLPGANGLTLVYKADDTDNPSTGTGTFPSGYDPGDNKTSTDRKPYQDGTEAIGRAASEPESGKRFLYWEYKKTNGETVKVYPGKPFTLDAADAEHVGPNSTPNQPQTSVMPASTPVRSASGGTRPLTAEEPTTVISWDFESGNLNDWTQIDNDGDGNVWYTYNGSTVSHGGSYCIYSESYRYNSFGSGGTVLYPDNWLISSGVLLPETGTNQISIWARGLGSTYYNEKFEVYVTTNKTSVANIKSNGTKVISETATGAYKEYTATIPDSYAGKTVYVVIRHGDVYDQYALLVDDVTVTNTPADAAGEGDEVIWVPVDTIDTTKDYLIGYIDDNGDTWLIMNYNPDASSSYYNFYVDDGQKTQKGAYAIKAIKNSEGKVTGLVSDTIVNATFDNVEWNFAEQTGGKYKIYHNNSYLRIDNSATTYTSAGIISSNTYYSENALSFYPGSDNDTFAVWTWNNKLTCAASNSITKAVIVLKNSSNVISGFCALPGSSDITLQLYQKEIIHQTKTYTVKFYGWNDVLLEDYTQEVEEFGAAVAPPESALGMPATGYRFAGWDPDDFDYVTGDMDVYAQFETVSGTNVYTVVFVDKDSNVISRQTVEEGQAAEAPATNPTAPTGYRFVGWDVDFSSVHSDLIVAPVFAKIVTDTYTITLHAVYADVEPEKKTHVTWYPNNGTDDYDDVTDIKMNTGFDIDTPELFKTHTGKDLVQNGYTFLGWARLPERVEHVNTYAPEKLRNENMYETYEVTEDGKTVTKIKEYHGLDESDLWLVYHPADENHTEAYFTVKNETGMTDGTEVTKIAPNEKMPYHGLYAVWRAKSFYVFHSATGKLEAYSYPDATRNNSTFNLVDKVTDGYLYGGYYTSYGGLNTVTLDGNTRTIADLVAAQFDSKGNAYAIDSSTSIAWSQSYSSGATPAVAELGADGVKAKTGFEAYTGASMKIADNSRRFWTRTKAYGNGDQAGADKGDSLKPEVGTVYYLKEVPADYLPSRLVTVRYTGEHDGVDQGNEPFSDLFLLTAVDDTLYSDVGFLYGTAKDPNTLASYTTFSNAFNVVYKDDKGDLQQTSYDAAALNSKLQRGYVAAYRVDVKSVTGEDKAAFILPAWTTFDGYTVSQNQVKFYVNNENQIVWNTNP